MRTHPRDGRSLRGSSLRRIYLVDITRSGRIYTGEQADCQTITRVESTPTQGNTRFGNPVALEAAEVQTDRNQIAANNTGTTPVVRRFKANGQPATTPTAAMIQAAFERARTVALGHPALVVPEGQPQHQGRGSHNVSRPGNAGNSIAPTVLTHAGPLATDNRTDESVDISPAIVVDTQALLERMATVFTTLEALPEGDWPPAMIHQCQLWTMVMELGLDMKGEVE